MPASRAYFVWLLTGKNRRELGQNGWKVVLPSARLTLLQILIGVVDLGFCALAMYLLMPMEPYIDFVSLAVVFILATLLGFASHAPGSIGVFDAAMLVALPQFGREQLLATLVVFRILYFLIPFGISIGIMGTRELWLSVVQPWLERRRLGEACTAKARVRRGCSHRSSAGNPEAGNGVVICAVWSFDAELPHSLISALPLTSNGAMARNPPTFDAVGRAGCRRAGRPVHAPPRRRRRPPAMGRCRFPGRCATASACSARSGISCCTPKPRAAAACWPPSRRWQSRATAAAGRAIR